MRWSTTHKKFGARLVIRPQSGRQVRRSLVRIAPPREVVDVAVDRVAVEDTSRRADPDKCPRRNEPDA